MWWMRVEELLFSRFIYLVSKDFISPSFYYLSFVVKCLVLFGMLRCDSRIGQVSRTQVVATVLFKDRIVSVVLYLMFIKEATACNDLSSW